jgi:hypothetical protein
MLSIIMFVEDQAIAIGEAADGRSLAPRRPPRPGRDTHLGSTHHVDDRAAVPADGQGDKQARIFICCKRADPYAEDLAVKLAAALGQTQPVYYDHTGAGLAWARQLDAYLRETDVVLALLTTQSAASELVEAELRRAWELAAEQQDGPRIVAVRLPSVEQLPYPLRIHVERSSHVAFTGSIAMLVEDIRQALNDATPEPPASAFHAPGLGRPRRVAPSAPLPWADPSRLAELADLDARWYVERDEARVMLNAIRRQGVTIAIKGPRQSGKTQLLGRLAAQARAEGKRVVGLDFQFLEPSEAADAAGFYERLLAAVGGELGVAPPAGSAWGTLPNNSICTAYFERELLPYLVQPLVLAIDGVDRLPDASLRADFLLMLRAWHNRRATSRAFRQLDLVLVTATEPAMLTSDAFGSPFNVAIGDTLRDFTPAQVGWLNQQHGGCLNSQQEHRLIAQLGGHPFLVRRALYLVSSKRWPAEELLALAADDGGPFGDHLRSHLFKLCMQPRLIRALQQILGGGRCADEQDYFDLHAAGLVSRDGPTVRLRCDIYADYLHRHIT